MKLDPLEIELGAKILYYTAKTFLSIWQYFHKSNSQHISLNKRKKKQNKKHRKRKHHS